MSRWRTSSRWLLGKFHISSSQWSVVVRGTPAAPNLAKMDRWGKEGEIGGRDYGEGGGGGKGWCAMGSEGGHSDMKTWSKRSDGGQRRVAKCEMQARRESIRRSKTGDPAEASFLKCISSKIHWRWRWILQRQSEKAFTQSFHHANMLLYICKGIFGLWTSHVISSLC